MFALVLIVYVSALLCTGQCRTAANALSIHALNPQAVGIDKHCISILTILQRVNITLTEVVTLYTVYPLSLGAGHSHKPIAFSVMATSICSPIHAALP